MPADRAEPGTRWILTLSLAIAASVLAGSAALRLEIRTSLVDLLPRDGEASEAYRVFLERFGGFEKVYVLVRPDEGSDEAETAVDDEMLADAAERLAERLEASDLVASARWGPTEEDERFVLEGLLPRAILHVDPAALERVRPRFEPKALRERAALLRTRLTGPVGPFEASLLTADPLGLAEELGGPFAGGEGLPVDPLTEAFAPPGGGATLVVVTPRATELDSESGQAMLALLERTYADVRAVLGADVRFGAVGGPLYAAQDSRSIRRNVVRAVLGSSLAVMLLLVLYFRGLLMPIALGASVAAGVVWTGGLITLARGGIGVLGISFASILVGLGVDYGIHGAAAFRRELLEGRTPGRAMPVALRTVGPAVVASVLTTLAAFLALTLADFEPLRELGILVSIGIVAVLVASVTLGAPVLVLFSRASPGAAGARPAGRLWRALDAFVDAAVRLGERRGGLVLGIATMATLLAVAGLFRVEFDGDPRRMRPADPATREIEETLARSFSLGVDSFHVVIEATSADEALGAAERVARELRAELPQASTLSPSDFLLGATSRRERAAAAAGVVSGARVALFRDELARHGLSAEAFDPSLALLEAIARGATPPEVPRGAWPDWVAQLLRVEPGRAFAAVRVSAPPDTWPDGPPDAVAQRVRSAAPSARLASVPLVARELRDRVHDELARLAEWAVLGVALVMLVSFRGSLTRTLLSLAPVSLGCLWLVGACGWFGWRIDLFSVAAAPLLLGIGIDDGLHALHGERTAGGLGRALRRVGSAMAMTTLTTCVGFTGLAFSGVPALASGGLLIASGTALCLLVSLVLLPALRGEHRRSPTIDLASPKPGRRAGEPRRGLGAPHAPTTGRMARLLGPFHVTGVFWYRLHEFGVSHAPRWMVRPTVLVFTTFFFLVLFSIRRAVAANLAVVLGPAGWLETQRRIYATLWSFAWCLTERYENVAGVARMRVRLEGRDFWAGLSTSRRGMIVLTGHVGNWEIGSALPATAEQRDVHLVREEELDPRAQEFIARLLAERMGARYHTHFASGDPALGLVLLGSLRRGEVVALQGDRPRRGGKTVSVELFGRPFELPAGPMALARAAAVPLLPVFMLREGRGKYRVCFHEPIHVAATTDRGKSLRDAAQRFAAALESAVRAEPHQWFCFRRLW